MIGQQLLQLRGVGRWTAEYALLRGFGRLQVFPGDDVGAQKNWRAGLDAQDPGLRWGGPGCRPVATIRRPGATSTSCSMAYHWRVRLNRMPSPRLRGES